jgi:hypothetical protein
VFGLRGKCERGWEEGGWDPQQFAYICYFLGINEIKMAKHLSHHICPTCFNILGVNYLICPSTPYLNTPNVPNAKADGFSSHPPDHHRGLLEWTKRRLLCYAIGTRTTLDTIYTWWEHRIQHSLKWFSKRNTSFNGVLGRFHAIPRLAKRGLAQ